MAMFSFNKPAGACPTCTGLGTVYAPDLARLLDEDKSILDGAVAGWDSVYTMPRNAETLRAAGRHYGFDFDPALPVRSLGPVQRDLLLYGVTGRALPAALPGRGTAGHRRQRPLRGRSSPPCCAATPNTPATPSTWRRSSAS